MRLLAACAAISLCLCAAVAARADDSTDKGRYALTGYIWGSSVATKVDTDDGSVSSHISFSDLFSHLSGGLQAHGRGEWGKWSVDLDGTWTKLRGEKQSKTVRLGPRGGIVIGGEVTSGLNEWIVEATAGYLLFETGSLFSNRPTDQRRFRGEAYLGARYWSLDPKITVEVNSTRFRIGDRSEWVDPILGLRFAIDLSPTVIFHVNGDVGGFDIGNYCSQFTWSQMTALSWAFADSWSAHVGYRFLDTHQNSGDVDNRTQMRGPFIAASYRF